VASAAGPIPQLSTATGWRDTLGRWQMRWGLGRDRYRVAPGLYAIGRPDEQAQVLVTANYKMTIDLLRRQLTGRSLWLLVLDTRGINVWCAAGKGTFGTAELLRRVQESALHKVVSHRTLLLPQLGAVGVAAHQVRRDSGFRVLYGPVRAEDLPAFLDHGLQATEEMRRVTFTAMERLILTPVELTAMLRITLWAAPVVFVLSGIGPGIFSLADAWQRGLCLFAIYLGGVFTGAVATPLFLPLLPGRAFAAKGAAAGAIIALLLLPTGAADDWALSAPLLLGLPAVASWCAMHFTGSTPYTSPSGVEKEMRTAIPLQGVALLVALGTWVAGAFF
jgi:hypothetical protein